MKIRNVLAGLAGGLLLGASPAFAQNFDADVQVNKEYNEIIEVDVDNTIDVKIQKTFKVTKDLDYTGEVTISGTIAVLRASLSLVDNKQIIDNNVVGESGAITGDNTATAIDDVLSEAVGNIQLNLAAGALNAQDNAAALSTADGTSISSDAEAFTIQKSAGNSSTQDGATNTAELLDQVLETAEGNIQVNVAAGVGNMQKNALSLALVDSDKALSEAVASVLQQHSFNTVASTGVTNVAQLTDSVLFDATGNIQVSLASGVLNGQVNSLSVAAGAI